MAKRLAGELVYRSKLEGADKMTTDARKAEGALGGMGTGAEGASGGLFTMKGAIMAAGAAFGTSKLIGYLKDGAKLAGEFEKKATKLGATLRHLGEDASAVKAITTELRGLSIAYAQASPEDVIDLYDQMITTSYGVVEAQREIHTILMANVAGYGENNELVERASRAQEIFGLETEDTARILEGYAVAGAKGHIETDKFVKAIEKEAPTLQQINAGFEETIGLLSALSSTGLGARKVVGGFGQMLMILAATTGPVADELARVGIVMGDGLIPGLEALAEKQDELDWYKIAPDVATQNLLKSAIENLDLIRGRIEDVSGAAGVLQEDFIEAADDAAYMSAITSAGMSEIKRSTGEAVLGGLAPLVAGFGEGADAGKFLTGILIGMAVGAYNVTHALVGLASVGLTEAINKFKLVGLAAKGAYYNMTLQFGKAKDNALEMIKVAHSTGDAVTAYFEGFRGAGWVDEMLAEVSTGAGSATTNVENLLKKLKELRTAAPPKPTPPGAAPAAGEPEGIPLEEQPGYRPHIELGIDTGEATEAGEIVGDVAEEGLTEALDAYFAEFEDGLRDREKQLEDMHASVAASFGADIRSAIFDGTSAGDIFARRLGAGVEAALSDAISRAMAKMAIADLLSQIPILGPFLGAFLGMQHGGVIPAVPGGVLRLFAEGGRPEVGFPLEADAILEVSKGIGRLVAARPAAEVATFGGADTPAGPGVTILVQDRDVLGLEAHEIFEQGAAAAALKIS